MRGITASPTREKRSEEEKPWSRGKKGKNLMQGGGIAGPFCCSEAQASTLA